MSTKAMILEPTAPPGIAPKTAVRALGGLRGKVVGFIDNVKPNFHHLVDELSELLVARYGVSSVVKHRKRTASVPASEAVLADVAARCDLVIAGSGD